MAEFLFEIGTEELPAGYMAPALTQMKSAFCQALKAESLAVGTVCVTGTPRRLVLWADGIPDCQPDRSEEVSGPPAKVAFDAQGKPTRAAEGFARAQGIALDQIEVRDTKKGKYCFAQKSIKGKPAAEILAGVLPDLVERVPFPKSMVWIPACKFTFARPIRSFVALFGSDVVKITVAGIESGRVTKGHPFLSPSSVTLASADFEAYKEALRREKVIVDHDERKKMVRGQIEAILARHGSSLQHEDLLDEVTNLVEYPCAIEGSFAEEYLAIPDAVIEAAMMGHQRYFPVRNAEGRLQARFIVVANRGGEHEGLIREGNERVLRARLADAQFFWDEDRKTKLDARVEALKGVQFLGDLGPNRSTYFHKAERLVSVTSDIAREVGADRDSAMAAAKLCKCDLATNMVKEFPSLQGIMGGEYAREEGQPEAVWKAIRDHYCPWSASDRLPETATGLAVSLADKFDNLASCFLAGKKPTGSQDPFALRRQALAILRILESRSLSLRLSMAVGVALSFLDLKAHGLRDEILSFFRDRLYQVCVDRGVRHDIANAVLETGFDALPDFFKRLDTIVAESKSDRWADLVFLVQRAGNVAKIGQAAERVEESLFEQEEERALWASFSKNKDRIADLAAKGDYAAASAEYCRAFSREVHEFFDKVFVNVENEKVRKNRIRMVKEISELYSKRIADLSQIVISGDGAKR